MPTCNECSGTGWIETDAERIRCGCPNNARLMRETLLTDVRTLQWYYQDGRTGAWTQQWDASQAQYPARIRLELGDARGDWPPLVFALARAR